DDVRYLHERIIDDDGEVIGGTAVGPKKDRIADDLRVERHLAAHEILKAGLDLLRHFESDHRPLARLGPRAGDLGRQIPAGTAILGGTPGRKILLPIALKRGSGTETVVRVATGQELVGVGGVEVQTLGLAIRSVRPADVRALVPVE